MTPVVLTPWNSEVRLLFMSFLLRKEMLSLVFMGSEKYPYKGIIDHLANRGFSDGTNAWTDNDHTGKKNHTLSHRS